MFGCFSVIYGVLLIPITNGSLHSDSEAATAMFVVVFAIMIGFLGLTPVGAFGESRLFFLVGLALALFGSVAFVSPGTLHQAMSYVLATMLLALGIIRLPVFLHGLRRNPSSIPAGYSMPYVIMHLLCLLLGLHIVFDWPNRWLIPLLIALGVCQWVLGVQAARLGPLVPEAPVEVARHPLLGRMRMSMRSQLMLLLAITMLFMAVMVVLAIARIVPYEGKRMSIGFVFIMAMQIMLVGSTPVHNFAPSWPLAILGMVLASAAMVASILPGLIDSALVITIGIGNLLTAGFGFVQLVAVSRRARKMPDIPARRTVWEVVAISTATYLLLIVFGFNLLVPGVVPKLVVLGVLVAAGVLLAWLSTMLDKLPSGPPKAQAAPTA